MKDLLVFAADADAEAFLRSLLERHQAIGIRPVTFDVNRHPQRDAGIVQSGAELLRLKKGAYGKVLMLWDHHGSGREFNSTADEVCQEIGDKLDRFTWSGNHGLAVLVPELEQWLWYCEQALAVHLNTPLMQIRDWCLERADELDVPIERLKQAQPKELFEHIVRVKLRRTISPRDFGQIGSKASMKALMSCPSFEQIVRLLRGWFPPVQP